MTVIGNHENFRVEVRPNFEDEGQFSITFWRSNHGSGLPYSITGEAKAIALGRQLYDTLFPEFVASEKRQKESIRRLNAELAARPKRKPPKVLKNAPILDVWICPECSHLILPDDVSDERVYECSRCNQTLSGDDARRCEQCNIFTAKISDTSCPECSAAMDDAEKGHAQRATNGELVRYFTAEEITARETARLEEQKKRNAAEAERLRLHQERCERANRIADAIERGANHFRAIESDGESVTFEYEARKFEVKEVD